MVVHKKRLNEFLAGKVKVLKVLAGLASTSEITLLYSLINDFGFFNPNRHMIKSLTKQNKPF